LEGYEQFLAYEREAIRYSRANKLLDFVLQFDADKVMLPDDYFHFLDTISLHHEQPVHSIHYYHFLNSYIDYRYWAEDHQQDTAGQQYLTKFDLAEEHLQKKGKAYIQYLLLNEFIEKASNVLAGEERIEKYLEDAEVKYLKRKIKYSYRQARQLRAGQPAPNFSLQGLEKQKYQLSDFEGKVVLLDFWASWCKPCIRQFPKTKKLKKQFEGQPFEVVYISLDNNRQKWEQAVDEHQLKGPHMLARGGFDHPVAKKYNIQSIPHYVLIDKEGKLLHKNARRPGDPTLKEDIQLLLNE
jgi:peroxiredoxin